MLPAYISKRLKQLQLQPVKEPESFAKLTNKQKKFVLAKVEGQTNTAAAMTAFDVTTREAQKRQATLLCKIRTSESLLLTSWPRRE